MTAPGGSGVRRKGAFGFAELDRSKDQGERIKDKGRKEDRGQEEGVNKIANFEF